MRIAVAIFSFLVAVLLMTPFLVPARVAVVPSLEERVFYRRYQVVTQDAVQWFVHVQIVWNASDPSFLARYPNQLWFEQNDMNLRVKRAIVDMFAQLSSEHIALQRDVVLDRLEKHIQQALPEARLAEFGWETLLVSPPAVAPPAPAVAPPAPRKARPASARKRTARQPGDFDTCRPWQPPASCQ